VYARGGRRKKDRPREEGGLIPKGRKWGPRPREPKTFPVEGATLPRGCKGYREGKLLKLLGRKIWVTDLGEKRESRAKERSGLYNGRLTPP